MSQETGPNAGKNRAAQPAEGLRAAHQANPTNTFFTGVVLTVVAAAAALTTMRLDDDDLSADQQFNFRLAIASVSVLLVVIWAFRIWVNPTGAPRRANTIVEVEQQLHGETAAMISYALERGHDVATADIAALAGKDVNGKDFDDDAKRLAVLNQAHGRLAKTVHPAMPKTLFLLRAESTSPKVFEWLGPVRLVRMFMTLGVLLVPVFVVLGLSIGVTSSAGDGFFGGNLIDRTRVALYLVTSATIGSTFAGLTKAFRYIANLSYDDKYESSYWVRLVLGIVAGLILAIVLSQALFDDNPDASTGFRITVPLLAIVGGFSSDLVYKILKRVNDALETLVSGSASEQVDVAVAEIEARGRSAAVEEKASIARQLIAIRDALPVGATNALNRVDETLDAVLGELPPTLTTVAANPPENEDAPSEDPPPG